MEVLAPRCGRRTGRRGSTSRRPRSAAARPGASPRRLPAPTSITAYQNGFTTWHSLAGRQRGLRRQAAHALGWIDPGLGQRRCVWTTAHVGSHVGHVRRRLLAAVAPGRPLWALSARRTWHFGATSVTPEFDWVRLSAVDGVHVTPRASVEMSTTLDDPRPSRRRASFAEALARPPAPRRRPGCYHAGRADRRCRAVRPGGRELRRDPPQRAVAQGVAPSWHGASVRGLDLAGAAWLTRRGTPDGNVALASGVGGVDLRGAGRGHPCGCRSLTADRGSRRRGFRPRETLRQLLPVGACRARLERDHSRRPAPR